jgi:hypothetical protein
MFAEHSWAAQVSIQAVGLDGVLIVEDTELMFVKLLDAEARIETRPPLLGRLPGPADAQLTVNVHIGDIGLRDLQVG